MDHTILLKKQIIMVYGVCRMTSYLSNRSQFVSQCNIQSRSKICGVCQGSAFGPILFNIYISDVWMFLTAPKGIRVHTNKGSIQARGCLQTRGSAEALTFRNRITYGKKSLQIRNITSDFSWIWTEIFASNQTNIFSANWKLCPRYKKNRFILHENSLQITDYFQIARTVSDSSFHFIHTKKADS